MFVFQFGANLYFCPMDLKDLRKDFGKESFDEQKLGEEPLIPLKQWITFAVEQKIPESNAMVLSTCANKKPSSRIVLLKELTDDGRLIFYTDYSSRKGKELAANPNASLLFFWYQLERQIRIEGTVSKVEEVLSETYFNSRPVESRVSAIVSKQSESVESLDKLIAERAFLLENPDKIKRPQRWGGYALKPDRIEFWQGGKYRMHHRIVFERNGMVWKKSRLAP